MMVDLFNDEKLKGYCGKMRNCRLPAFSRAFFFMGSCIKFVHIVKVCKHQVRKQDLVSSIQPKTCKTFWSAHSLDKLGILCVGLNTFKKIIG